MCGATSALWQSGEDRDGRDPLRGHHHRPLPLPPLLLYGCLRGRLGPWAERGSCSLNIERIGEDDRIVEQGEHAKQRRGVDNTEDCPYYFYLGREPKKPKE